MSRMHVFLALTAVACHGGTMRAAVPQAADWSAVDVAIGRAGADQPGGVRRYSFPRADLQVSISGTRVMPALALGSWIAFLPTAGGTVVMGDLVLADTELTPVLRALQRGGVEQTAVHHHLVRESPRVLYVHIHGHGDPVAIATTVRQALRLTGTPPAAPPAAAADFPLDTAAIATALGSGGRVNGGVYQVGIPRAEAIRLHGVEIPPSMGLATAINFQPTGPSRAAITGDFVLLAAEVNPVIAALLENGIEVTSLHSHLLEEEPRLFFMHFWADDDALRLARGLRAALDRTSSRRAR